MQASLPVVVHHFRAMHREDVNNQQQTPWQTFFDFAGRIVQNLTETYVANIRNDTNLAGIEAQAARDARRDMIVYQSMQPFRPSGASSNFGSRYRIEQNDETHSDSDRSA